MPNWCNNVFTVKGDSEKVAEFVEQMKGISYDHEGTPTGEENLDFNKVIPLPEVLKGRSDINDIGWYEWSVVNWGTKWNVCEAQLEYNNGDDGAVYYFDTAWSPPVGWFETVVKYYPWLDFCIEWEEGGMGFAGTYESVNGELGPMSEWDIVWDEDEEEFVVAE